MSYIMIIISGILYILPFFNPNLFILSWIAFIPFLYSVYYTNYKNLFYKAWVLGFIILTGVGYPLYFPIKSFSNFPSIVVIFILIILFLILSLIYGLWGKLLSIIINKNEFNPYVFSISWLGLEIIRHVIMNFFPLGYLGYTQANFNHFIQISDLGGVFLVSFIIALLNSLIFKFIISKRKKYIIISILIVGLVLSYGFYKINRYEDIEKSLDIGIVHTHINQNDKWNRDNVNKYIDLFTAQDKEFEDVELVITPESALTFDMNREVYYRDKVLNRVEASNKYFQIGFLATKDNESNYYNSTYLINSRGEIKNRYNKNKLLLFGEYVIFSGLIEKLTGYRLNTLNPGKNIIDFQTPFAKWKTVICSEILYPEYVSKHLNSLDFIVNKSNEAWFEDNTTLKNQMYASLVFRAIENRRSIIKAGNMTYSGIVYPSGQREKYDKKINEKLKVSIKKHKEITLFNKIMNIFLKNPDFMQE